MTISIIAFCLTGLMLLGRTIHIDETSDCFPWLKLVRLLFQHKYETVDSRNFSIIPSVIILIFITAQELLIGIISTLSFMAVFGRMIAVVPTDLPDTLLLHGVTVSQRSVFLHFSSSANVKNQSFFFLSLFYRSFHSSQSYSTGGIRCGYTVNCADYPHVRVVS